MSLGYVFWQCFGGLLHLPEPSLLKTLKKRKRAGTTNVLVVECKGLNLDILGSTIACRAMVAGSSSMPHLEVKSILLFSFWSNFFLCCLGSC